MWLLCVIVHIYICVYPRARAPNLAIHSTWYQLTILTTPSTITYANIFDLIITQKKNNNILSFFIWKTWVICFWTNFTSQGYTSILNHHSRKKKSIYLFLDEKKISYIYNDFSQFAFFFIEKKKHSEFSTRIILINLSNWIQAVHIRWPTRIGSTMKIGMYF